MKIKLVFIFMIISTRLLYSQHSSKLLFSIEIEKDHKYYNSFYITDNIDSIPKLDLTKSLSEHICLIRKKLSATEEPLIGMNYLNTVNFFKSEKEYMIFIKQSRKLLRRFKPVGTIQYSLYERIHIEVVEVNCQLIKSLIKKNDILPNALILNSHCSELRYRMIISSIISSNKVNRRNIQEIKSRLIPSL